MREFKYRPIILRNTVIFNQFYEVYLFHKLLATLAYYRLYAFSVFQVKVILKLNANIKGLLIHVYIIHA